MIAPFLMLAATMATIRPAAAGSSAMPDTAQFELIAIIPGFGLGKTPWSPTRDDLLLIGNGGLFVTSVGRECSTPQRILSSRTAPQYAWSPDGRWLACRVGGPHRPSAPEQPELVAVSPSTGEEIQLLRGVYFRDFAWTPSGRIRVDFDGGGDSTIDDQRLRSRGALGRPTLIVDIHRASGLRLARMTDHGKVPVEILLAPGGHALFEDAFPDGHRFLVSVSFPYWRTVVIDSSGLILEELGRHTRDAPSATELGAGKHTVGFKGRSVSSDGQVVAGELEIDKDEMIESSTVMICDLASKRVRPLMAGYEPAFSRRSNILAFSAARGVYLVRLRMAEH